MANMEHKFYLLKEKEVHFKPSKDVRLGNIFCTLIPTEPADEVNRTKCEAFGKTLKRKLAPRNWVLNMNFNFNQFQDKGRDVVAADVVLKGILLSNLTDIVSLTDCWSAPPILTLEVEFFKGLKSMGSCCLDYLKTGFEASQDSDGCPIFKKSSSRVNHRCVVEGTPESSPCIQEILSYGKGPTSYDNGNDHWKMHLTLVLGLREAPESAHDSSDENDDFSDAGVDESWSGGFSIAVALNISNININGNNTNQMSEENLAVQENCEGFQEDWDGAAAGALTDSGVSNDYSQEASDEESDPEPARIWRARLSNVGNVSSSEIEKKADETVRQKKNKKRKFREDEGPDAKRMTMDSL